MSTRFLSIILASIILTSCSSRKLHNPQPLTPSELNTNAAKYNGQTVEIRGYILLAPEAHVLYESKSINTEFQYRMKVTNGHADLKSYVKYCLTIANPAILFHNEKTVNKKTLIIRGKFIDNYLGPRDIDLGACPLPTGFIIDEDDLRHRYPGLVPVK
jgi:hypothetical protein